MKNRPGLVVGVFVVTALLAAGRVALGQVVMNDTEITVAGEQVITSSGLCTLYSLTGKKPDVSLGCPKQEVRYIFASTGTIEGNFGGVVLADIGCGIAGAFAGLPGSAVFLAWLADGNPSSAPNSRFEKASPTTWYVLPSGKIVAIGWDDLTDGQLEWGIGEDAAGNAITSPYTAWTNVNRDGTQRSSADGHCNNWTDNEFIPATKYDECDYATHPTEVGFTGSAAYTTTTFSWTEGGSRCCDSNTSDPTGTIPEPSRQGRIICVQQAP